MGSIRWWNAFSTVAARRVAPVVAAAFVATLLSLTALPSASASHYYLTDVTWFSKDQVVTLSQSGIQTTKHLLEATLTSEDRKKLAASLAVDENKVLEVARECELLQIRGVGPKVVKLLKATGVTSLDDLAGRDAADLLGKIEAINKTSKITEKNPTVDIVSYWIGQARKATVRVKP